MKTLNKKNLLGAGMAIAMALAAWLPVTAHAEEAKKPMKPMRPVASGNHCQ